MYRSGSIQEEIRRKGRGARPCCALRRRHVDLDRRARSVTRYCDASPHGLSLSTSRINGAPGNLIIMNLLKRAGRKAGTISAELPDSVISEIRKTKAGRKWLAEKAEAEKWRTRHAEFERMIESGVYVDPKTGKTSKVVDMSDQCCIMVVVGPNEPHSWYERLIIKLYIKLFGLDARITRNVLRALRNRPTRVVPADKSGISVRVTRPKRPSTDH